MRYTAFSAEAATSNELYLRTERFAEKVGSSNGPDTVFMLDGKDKIVRIFHTKRLCMSVDLSMLYLISQEDIMLQILFLFIHIVFTGIILLIVLAS